MTGTYLDDILEAHRHAAANDSRSLGALVDAARLADPTRGFRSALARAAATGVAIVAEVKRRSPSRGPLAPGLDAGVLAAAYEAGGAACVSVLTDEAYFGGSAGDLRAARAEIDVPVIRKDFTVSAHDVADARIMGADCVLLIVAALDDAELADLHALAVDLGMDVLVEVHDEREVERALEVGATLIGVNQRDLVTFKVDTARAVRVAPTLPEGVVRVAESGITRPSDVGPLVDAGFHAVLVGEHLVTAADPAAAVADLRRAHR
jgi:indole-3-glycerol phosphate synthase